MLGVYSMYPHQICAHVANADVTILFVYKLLEIYELLETPTD
jgi:hypothetical protein